MFLSGVSGDAGTEVPILTDSALHSWVRHQLSARSGRNHHFGPVQWGIRNETFTFVPAIHYPGDYRNSGQRVFGKATDDANKVEAAVAAAAPLLADADKYQKTIAGITMPVTKSANPALDDLQQLQTTVEAISRSKLIDNLTNKKADLTATESARSSDCSPSQLPPNQQQDVTDAIAKCKKAEKDAKATSDAIDAALSGLQTSLGTISPYVGDQVTALQDKLKRFSDTKLTGDSPDVSTILDVLPTNLPVLKQVLQSKDQYQTTWNSTKKVLSDLKIAAGAKNATSDAAKDPDAEFQKLKDKVDAILPSLDAWFKAIADKMQAEATSFDNLISGVLGDPAKNSPTALDAVRKQGEDISSAQAVADAWPPLVGFLVDGQPDAFHLKTTKGDLEAMQKWVNVARGAVSRVHDALAGDFSGFETDQVSLYYFTDISRLMYALNEGFQTKGGVAEAQEEAKAQRKALTETELELADAQATVNRYQKQVLDLQEQQRQAQAKLKGLDGNVSKLGNRLNRAQAEKDQATSDAAKAQATANSDPSKAPAAEKAKAKQDAATTKLSNAQSDYDATKKERDNSQKQADDSQNQSDSLPAKLAAAQQALSDAQTAVAAERRKMILAAQTESDAFAFARDNTPFMYAPADASSSDPAKRVILYAFNDSKTMLNESMEIVDEELGDTRALENTTLARLRDIINDAVGHLASLPLPNPPYPLGAECSNLGDNSTPADCEKLKRVIQFYDPSVLKQLNFDRMKVNQPDRLALVRKLIPDPADTTTLGEALLVLSLARPVTKNCVRHKFEQDIRSRLSKLPITSKGQKNQTDAGDKELLPLTWHALDVWEDGAAACAFDADELAVPVTPGLEASQLEIVRALRASYDSFVLRDVLEKIESWRAELGGRSTQGKCPPTPPKCLADAGLYSNLDDIKNRISAYVERGKVLLSNNEAKNLTTLQVDPDVPDVPSLDNPKSMEKARLTRKAINGPVARHGDPR